MKHDLILCRGRIGDRTAGAIAGADLTARALASFLSETPIEIGSPDPFESDDWRRSLPQASASLAGIRRAVEDSLNEGHRPCLVAGTCSASLATLPVVASRLPEAFVVWFDAHGDFNTPDTTRSGYLGGMVLAAACGLWDSGHGSGLRGSQVIIVGGRDFDETEAELLHRAGVRIVPPASADPETVRGMVGSSPVWVHMDWDALEPGQVPAAYRVPDGLTTGQVKAILQALPVEQIAGIELAEFEASGDGQQDGKAVAAIVDMVDPVFGH